MRTKNFTLAIANSMLIFALLAITTDAGAANRFYRQKNLVSDGFIPASFTDPNLVNAWGLVSSPTGPWWVANEGTGTSTLYTRNGTPQALVVNIPPAPGSGKGHGGPTGIVFNGGDDFVVSNGTASGPSRFIFAGEDGVITAWSPAVPPPPPSTQAFIVVDSSADGAAYLGLALSRNSSGRFLYAADFANGRIDVFDSSFQPATLAGSFTDPDLPKDYAPFAVHAIGQSLFVAYALRDDEGEEVPGPGNGYVDEFDTEGNMIRRFASRGALNAPWGMALAPSNFGTFSNALLVGNFGDGRINAYNATTGAFLGTLSNQHRDPLEIEGLWGINFGNGGDAGPTNALYFAAGPEDEEHGLFGRIDFIPPGLAGRIP